MFSNSGEADVGISVDTAVDAAKDADVVLLDKDLNVLEGIFRGQKDIYQYVQIIRITASSNFGNIFLLYAPVRSFLFTYDSHSFFVELTV